MSRSQRHSPVRRYSHAHSSSVTPTIFGDGDTFSDGYNYVTTVNNGGLQLDWTLKPTLLLTSRFAVDRVFAPGFTTYHQQPRLDFRRSWIPRIRDGSDARHPRGLRGRRFFQCCVDTNFAHSLYSYSSALAWAKGSTVSSSAVSSASSITTFNSLAIFRLLPFRADSHGAVY